MISQLISPFQCILVAVLNETNVNALFQHPIRLNVDLDAVKRAMKYHREAYIHDDIKNWKLEEDNHLPSLLRAKGTSICMLLFRTLRVNDLQQWESSFYRKDPSLTNSRHKILNTMIQLGLDVNLQVEHIYNWDPRKV